MRRGGTERQRGEGDPDGGTDAQLQTTREQEVSFPQGERLESLCRRRRCILEHLSIRRGSHRPAVDNQRGECARPQTGIDLAPSRGKQASSHARGRAADGGPPRAPARPRGATRGAGRDWLRRRLPRSRGAASSAVRGTGAAGRTDRRADRRVRARVARGVRRRRGLHDPHSDPVRACAVSDRSCVGAARRRRGAHARALTRHRPRPQPRPSAARVGRQRLVRRRPCARARLLHGLRAEVVGLADLPARARDAVSRRHGRRRGPRMARARRTAALAAADDGPRVPRRRAAHADRLPRRGRRAGLAAGVPARAAAGGAATRLRA